MFNKDPRLLFKGWSILTLFAVFAAIAAVITGHLVSVVVPTAGMMVFLWLYLAIQFKIDGPSFSRIIDDERMEQNSSRAMRTACWFFYISLWLLAIGYNSGLLEAWKNHAGSVLEGVVMVGLIIHMCTFIGYKYRV